MPSNRRLLKRSSNQLGIAMIGCCKRLKDEGDNLDRLTDLPINVKHQIQEHLPIEEAAKMSVLSKPWRHVWASMPQLVFSPQFCQSKPSHTLINIVDTILSQHCGAIKTFHLNISTIPSPQHPVIDQWMLLLSTNGLMDLTLQNLGNVAPYALPSCVYGVELENLFLSNCIFRPPCSFRGLHKLKDLHLIQVTLELDVATSFLSMPNLLNLRVRSCSGAHHLKICAPELLRVLYYTSSLETFKLDHLMNCRKLDTVIIVSSKYQDEAMNLTYLLKCWPEVSRLIVDCYYLKSFAYGNEAERLPTSLNSLKHLIAFGFDFDDDDQIFSLLRMLKSSPNLEDLQFVSSFVKKGGLEVDVNHFEGPAYRTQGLNKLHILTMKNFGGSRNELLFVRFILSAAPLLLKTILMADARSVDESQCLKISKELMGLPRASPKLEIICEPSALREQVLY